MNATPTKNCTFRLPYMSIPTTFSPATRSLMEKSRLIALDLGYAYITTIHFYLADCALDQPGSLRSFSFPTEQAYQAFYASYRKDEASILADPTLPLTVEAERAIRRSLIEKQLYGAGQLEPYHVLLGAAYNKDSLLRTVLRRKEEDIYTALKKYYASKGLLPVPTKRKWWQLF